MNASANVSGTGIGFLRRRLADALVATTLVAMAGVGLIATAHADDGDPAPNPEPTPAATAPAPGMPWLGLVDPGCTRPLYYYNGRVHCG